MKCLPVVLGALLALSFNVEAATYWVDGTNGSDSNSCTNSTTALSTAAKRTIYTAIGCMAAGDTLYIRAGVYAESLGNFNSGTSSIFPNGTSGQYTRVARWQSESVTVRPPFSGAGCHGFPDGYCRALYLLANRYIEFDGLILDGANQTVNNNGGSCTQYAPVGAQAILLQSLNATESSSNPDDYTHHIRLKNLEVKNWPGYMISQKHPNVDPIDVNAFGGHEIINSNIHDVGLDRYIGQNVAVYMTTANWVVSGNTFHNMPSAITVYNTFGRSHVMGAIIANNTFYNIGNTHPGCDAGPAGITVAAPNANPLIYNNIFYGNTTGTSGVNAIRVTGGNNTRIFNNTFYNASDSGIETSIENHVGSTGGGAFNTVIINNIVWRSSGTAISQEVNATTAYATNMCRTAGTGCTVIAPTASDIFVSPSSNDFRLKSGSPAIGAGTNLSSVLTSTSTSGAVSLQSSTAWNIGADVGAISSILPSRPINIQVSK
jgi:hypothetical protein